jgi:hypothetical protein
MITQRPPIGTTVLLILAAPHKRWRLIQTIGIRTRRAGCRRNMRNLDVMNAQHNDCRGHGRESLGADRRRTNPKGGGVPSASAQAGS